MVTGNHSCCYLIGLSTAPSSLPETNVSTGVKSIHPFRTIRITLWTEIHPPVERSKTCRHCDRTLNISRPSYRSFPWSTSRSCRCSCHSIEEYNQSVYMYINGAKRVRFESFGLLVPVIEAVLGIVSLVLTNPMIPIVPKPHIGIMSAPMSVLCGVHTVYSDVSVYTRFVCVNWTRIQSCMVAPNFQMRV